MLTVNYLPFGNSIPLIDDSLESRLSSSSLSDEDSQYEFTPGLPNVAIPDDQTPVRTDGDNESPADADGISPLLDEDDVHCKVQLRRDIEQCLTGFEQERKVFENPDLTTRQRRSLTSDFCR